MTDVVLFQYRTGDSMLHRADPRIKTAAYLAFNVAIAAARLPGVGIAAAVLVAGYAVTGVSVAQPLRAGWPVMLLAFFVFISRSVSASGPDAMSVMSFGPVQLYAAGLRSGGLFSVRLLAALYAAHLFVATTPVRALSQVVRWAVSPLFPEAAARLSAMIGLAVAFIPVFFQLTTDSTAALLARGLSPLRSPFRYLRTFSVVTLHALLYRAVEISAALESRSFRPASDVPTFTPLRLLEPRAAAATAVCAAGAALAAAGLFL